MLYSLVVVYERDADMEAYRESKVLIKHDWYKQYSVRSIIHHY